MKKFVIAAFFGLIALAGCKESGKVESTENAKKLPAPTQYLDKVSYGLGQQLGMQMRMDTSVKVNMDYFIRGYMDGLDSIFTGERDSVATAMQKYQQDLMLSQRKMQENMQKAMEAKGKVMQEQGTKFYDEFKGQGNVIQSASGLLSKMITKGSGAKPSDTSWVRVHIIGTLSDGTEFDNTYKKNKPAEFPVMGVPPGMAEAIKMMPVGSTYEFVIPDKIGFGPQGMGSMIPPNSTFKMKIELVAIIPSKQQPGMPGGPGMPPPPMPRK